ncbi:MULTISPECIES: family 43 glycosylhydrolase [Leeuwenhoekiella]|jgi:GH43 family beta-xylosidase|uniref:family 43 glycosylhydrolase n=3 Tax=Flavobacteriaceae TaxID=49546 RepID=UPI000C523EB7|nr:MULTISPECIES: family 43 glycosylhydrolase [Leeuwenhoekiella]MAO43053.1 beta-xylosidase [Leeuwenhoekiella sp.]MBQ50971.1 beta-xylosidase [Leeuwenhoekiella sp.]HCW65229.1 beta-xylosidase [Leeuwenhoekiella sp.]|tara:strand:- start:1824 stop:3995 length:2172 start_codon:yes stop_codon:yes gene_type:complete
MFKFRLVFILALLVSSQVFYSCDTTKTADDYTAYLFVYFTGNRAGEEAVHYALSRNGFDYYALNDDKPIVSTDSISTTGGVRDPHILRGEDGNFYMVLTDLKTDNGWSNTEIILAKSTDLLNWETSQINLAEEFSEFSDISRAWAPQTIYDAEAGKYMVYFSMLQPGGYDIIYYAYANEDFTALESTPKQLFYSPDEKSCIDADIIKKDDKYYMFYKTEGTATKGIRVAVSDSLTSGYVPEEGYKDQTDRAVEGSSVFKMIDSDKYILMYDMYVDGKYQFAESTDLLNFKALGADKVSMNFHPRHGTIIPVTESEAAQLLKAFPSEELPLLVGARAKAIRQQNIVTDAETATMYLPVYADSSLTDLDPQLVTFPGVSLLETGTKDFSSNAHSYTLSLPDGTSKTYTVEAALANNPVLDGFYADPEIIYSEKDQKFYLYPTSDGFDSWSGTYFKTFSSKDLVHWEDEGVILDLKKDVSWANRNAWAPCIAEKEIDGALKYFYYFSAAQTIGLATADDPAGPFTDSGEAFVGTKPQAIKRGGGQIIDPDVFIDPNDGKAYFYWGNGYMAGAELNEDMISYKEETLAELTPDGTFREGTEVFFRDGKYYFMWSEDDTRSPNYRVRYATAESPLGPLNIPEENMVIEKDEDNEIYGTGHNSVINVPGTDDWYIVYHRFTRPKGITMGRPAGFHREVCIDKLTFAEDGSIIEVTPTLEGIAPVTIPVE